MCLPVICGKGELLAAYATLTCSRAKYELGEVDGNLPTARERSSRARNIKTNKNKDNEMKTRLLGLIIFIQINFIVIGCILVYFIMWEINNVERIVISASSGWFN